MSQAKNSKKKMEELLAELENLRSQLADVTTSKEAEPSLVMVEVPEFEYLYCVGKGTNGQLFYLLQGDADLVSIAGLLDYSMRVKEKLWKEFV